ncbi:MAG TPA: MFS transporter [Myxococcota bacterium]
MTELGLSPIQRRMHLVAVIAAMSVTALIYGLSLPLLALVMNAHGVDGTLIGLSAATQSLAIVFVAPFLPPFMARIGPAVIMLGAILVSLTAFLLLPVFTSLPAWFALRFAIGAAGSCLWVCGEAWINQVADDSSRGRVVALYSMAVAGGFALGPLLLSVAGTEGPRPFLVSGAIVLLSAVPLLSVAQSAPLLGGERRGGLPYYLRLAPVPMLLCAVYALADGILLTFLPLYGIQLGLSEPRSLYLITLFGVGGVLGQIPVGWLADRMNRMLLASICTLLVALASLGMPLVLAYTPWNLLFMLVFGTVLSGIYTIAMVLIGERFRGADLAAASALFGVMWGSGSILGPPVGGLAMDAYGPHGLPLALTLLFALALLPPVGAWLRERRGESP